MNAIVIGLVVLVVLAGAFWAFGGASSKESFESVGEIERQIAKLRATAKSVTITLDGDVVTLRVAGSDWAKLMSHEFPDNAQSAEAHIKTWANQFWPVAVNIVRKSGGENVNYAVSRSATGKPIKISRKPPIGVKPGKFLVETNLGLGFEPIGSKMPRSTRGIKKSKKIKTTRPYNDDDDDNKGRGYAWGQKKRQPGGLAAFWEWLFGRRNARTVTTAAATAAATAAVTTAAIAPQAVGYFSSM